MKSVADMSIEELAGLVCETLANAGITITLSMREFCVIRS